jgi:hypothetical protein
MRRFDELDKTELRDLLVRNWMTHEAMWFANSLRHFGIEKTNQLNRAATRAMAAIEATRLKKLLGVGTITSFDELRTFTEQAFEILRGPFMQFELTFPRQNVMVWTVQHCLAHESMTKLGVAERYQCAIYHRFDAWLEVLKLSYTAAPALNGCQMQSKGHCTREYQVDL